MKKSILITITALAIGTAVGAQSSGNNYSSVSVQQVFAQLQAQIAADETAITEAKNANPPLTSEVLLQTIQTKLQDEHMLAAKGTLLQRLTDAAFFPGTPFAPIFPQQQRQRPQPPRPASK